MIVGMAMGLGVASAALLGFSIWTARRWGEARVPNRLPPAGRFLDGPAEFSFAVMGDSTGHIVTFAQILRHIRDHGPFAFVFHVGDQAKRPVSAHFEWLLAEIHRAAGPMPFFSIPGNHDVDKKANAPAHRLRHYHRAFGQTDYWFSHGATLFVALDNSAGRLEDPQLAWLDSTLEKLRPLFRSLIVFMHAPPAKPGPGKYDCMKRGGDELYAILKRHSADAIFCGHIHAHHDAMFHDIPMRVAPSSGQHFRGDDERVGYIACRMSADGLAEARLVCVEAKRRQKFVQYYAATKLHRILPIAALILLLASLAGFWIGLHGAAGK